MTLRHGPELGLALGGVTIGIADGSAATAIVVAGDEEERVLLLGLLRLHHVRVDGEAEGALNALELVRDYRPSLMVADTHLVEGSPAALARDARAIVPTVRVILTAPVARPPADPSHGADVVLLWPFRIQQFADALGATIQAAASRTR